MKVNTIYDENGTDIQFIPVPPTNDEFGGIKASARNTETHDNEVFVDDETGKAYVARIDSDEAVEAREKMSEDIANLSKNKLDVALFNNGNLKLVVESDGKLHAYVNDGNEVTA